MNDHRPSPSLLPGIKGYSPCLDEFAYVDSKEDRGGFGCQGETRGGSGDQGEGRSLVDFNGLQCLLSAHIADHSCHKGMLGEIGGKRKDSPRIALVVEMEEIDFVV